MESRKFDPRHPEELLKHFDKQNALLTDAYKSMLHESQKLQVEEEMLMRKLYEVMSSHGLIKKKEHHSNASCYSGAEQSNANANAVTVER